MKERPILFSAPMVRAHLGGSKTQTRRAVKMPPSWDCIVYADWGNGYWPYRSDDGESPNYDNNEIPLRCSYGQPGDRVWVRETLACTAHHGTWYDADEDGFNNMIDDERADALASRYGDHYFETEVRRIPSIHMPRWASRILLEITSVRVERLQDISASDCRAEGIDQCDGIGSNAEILELAKRIEPYEQEVLRYATLWESINGAGSWDANPWVWVVEFKRVMP